MIKRDPLVIFTLLTFGLTWIVWAPRAAGVPVGTLGQLWTWMPAVAALIAAALTGGREAVRDLLRRLVRWRVACSFWTSASSRSCLPGFRTNPGERAHRRAAACIDRSVRSLTGDHR
jgi:hypothetical protein